MSKTCDQLKKAGTGCKDPGRIHLPEVIPGVSSTATKWKIAFLEYDDHGITRLLLPIAGMGQVAGVSLQTHEAIPLNGDRKPLFESPKTRGSNPDEDRNPVETELESFFNDCHNGGKPKADLEVGLADSTAVILSNLCMDQERRVYFKEMDTMGKNVSPQQMATNFAAAQSSYSRSLIAKKKVS